MSFGSGAQARHTSVRVAYTVREAEVHEALRLAGMPVARLLGAGRSGDAFWLTYYNTTRDINWGGFAKDVLVRGLGNFGFDCELVDEVDEQDAWNRLSAALGEGKTVITPLHVSAATVLGSGFGGSEWVFVTGIDRGEVLVNCLLGDGLRFTPEHFRASWCVHHPLEPRSEGKCLKVWTLGASMPCQESRIR